MKYILFLILSLTLFTLSIVSRADAPGPVTPGQPYVPEDQDGYLVPDPSSSVVNETKQTKADECWTFFKDHHELSTNQALPFEECYHAKRVEVASSGNSEATKQPLEQLDREYKNIRVDICKKLTKGSELTKCLAEIEENSSSAKASKAPIETNRTDLSTPTQTDTSTPTLTDIDIPPVPQTKSEDDDEDDDNNGSSQLPPELRLPKVYVGLPKTCEEAKNAFIGSQEDLYDQEVKNFSPYKTLGELEYARANLLKQIAFQEALKKIGEDYRKNNPDAKDDYEFYTSLFALLGKDQDQNGISDIQNLENLKADCQTTSGKSCGLVTQVMKAPSQVVSTIMSTLGSYTSEVITVQKVYEHFKILTEGQNFSTLKKLSDVFNHNQSLVSFFKGKYPLKIECEDDDENCVFNSIDPEKENEAPEDKIKRLKDKLKLITDKITEFHKEDEYSYLQTTKNAYEKMKELCEDEDDPKKTSYVSPLSCDPELSTFDSSVDELVHFGEDLIGVIRDPRSTLAPPSSKLADGPEHFENGNGKKSEDTRGPSSSPKPSKLEDTVTERAIKACPNAVLDGVIINGRKEITVKGCDKFDFTGELISRGMSAMTEILPYGAQTYNLKSYLIPATYQGCQMKEQKSYGNYLNSAYGSFNSWNQGYLTNTFMNPFGFTGGLGYMTPPLGMMNMMSFNFTGC